MKYGNVLSLFENCIFAPFRTVLHRLTDKLAHVLGLQQTSSMPLISKTALKDSDRWRKHPPLYSQSLRNLDLLLNPIATRSKGA